MLSSEFNRNYFELFEINPSFELDPTQLHSRQQQLQSGCHPDRFVNAGEHEKRLSVQMAAWVNQAYETLRDPVKRAVYLLEISANTGGDDSETTSDTVFLMEQLELREQIEACRSSSDPIDCCDLIATDLDQRFDEMSRKFADSFNASDLELARQISRKMQFMQRIQEQLSELRFELEDI